MKGAGMDFKRYFIIGATLTLLLGAGCASSPEEPTDSNSPPRIDAIVEGSGRRVIGAGGTAVTLRAETIDVDGDALEFVWTGPGNFGVPNSTTKTVTWTPPDAIGTATVTCRVTDPSDESASLSVNFRLVRQITISDPGDVVANQIVWSGAAGEDYLLKGQVIIPDGIELVITGGATIYCDSNSRLTARGGLSVTGSRSAVRFLANVSGAGAGFWQGIYFESSSMPLGVQGLTISNAFVGLNLNQSVPQGATVMDCEFSACTSGIEVFNTAIAISGSTFDDCDKSLVLDSCTIESLTGCNFTGTQINAIRVQGSGSSGRVEGNSFNANATAFIETNGGAAVAFNGNSFFGSGTVFILTASGELDAECNNWGLGASEATIPARIEFGSSGGSIDFIPYLPGGDPDGECP